MNKGWVRPVEIGVIVLLFVLSGRNPVLYAAQGQVQTDPQSSTGRSGVSDMDLLAQNKGATGAGARGKDLQTDQNGGSLDPYAGFNHPYCRKHYIGPGAACFSAVRRAGYSTRAIDYSEDQCARLFGAHNGRYRRCLASDGEKDFTHTLWTQINLIPLAPIAWEAGLEYSIADNFTGYLSAGMILAVFPVSLEVGARFYSEPQHWKWFAGAGFEFSPIFSFVSNQVRVPIYGGYRFRLRSMDLTLYAGVSTKIWDNYNYTPMIASFVDHLFPGTGMFFPSLGVELNLPLFRRTPTQDAFDVLKTADNP